MRRPTTTFAVSALTLAVLAAGCATTPPPTDALDRAESAIDAARAEGAVEQAPMELRFARDKLEAARTAVDEEAYTRARRLASEARVNAELAVAKTQSAKARATVEDLRRRIEELQRDIERAQEDTS